MQKKLTGIFQALFLTHDGYLGSLGAFLLLHKKLT
jgi:pantothenate kinase